jgi:hypothetical protein
MKIAIMPSRAKHLTVEMHAFSNHANITEAKSVEGLEATFWVYVRSLVVCATRDDHVFV